jgi:TonB-linked SusC/RagA family outer membrane protein
MYATAFSTPTARILQDKVVSGKVTSSGDKQGIPGVNIVIKGANMGTVTDVEGVYTLSIPSGIGDILVYTAIGFVTQERSVGDQSIIDIVLDEDVTTLDEVVVVGYGTQKRSDLTGSIARISAADFETKAITNIVEGLAGTVPGFYSVQGTTAAGGGSMEIRGPTSLAANNEPLIVLDGVIYSGTMSDINPSDVESIDILKDASSAAIFGSRAASGVVVITTKRGKVSKPSINVSSKIGIVGLTNHLKPFGPEGYLNLRGDFLKRFRPDAQAEYFTHPDHLPPGVSIDEWTNYDPTPSDDPTGVYLLRLGLSPIEQENYRAGKSFDWYDEIVRNGIRQDYDVSISGGVQDLRYYFSSGLVRNEGVTLGDEFKTFQSRINLEADVTDFLKVGVNAHFADRDAGFNTIPISRAIAMSPWTQIYHEGEMVMYPNEWRLNPFLEYTHRDQVDKTQSLFANFFGEVQLPLGFSYRVNFSNSLQWGRQYMYDPIETANGLSLGGYGSRVNEQRYDWMVDNLIKWNRIINDIHRFDVTFLINAEKKQHWWDSQINFGMEPSGVLGYHALQAGNNPEIENSDTYITGNALMARLNYVLKDRYMLTTSFRRDGYSAFGQGNPYAYFPSVALAWTLSEEEFFKSNWFSNLKVRASWGRNGNRDIGPYDSFAQLSSTRYLYGTSVAAGTFSSKMANSQLRWENTESINLGIDFGLFENRISGSVDVYSSTTTDLLLERSLPEIIGYRSVMSNMGELQNRGMEVSLNSINVNNTNVTWKSNLIFSFNRNKIVSLYGDMTDVYDGAGNVIGQREADDLSNQWFIGQSIDRIWDYETLGIWQTEEEAEASAVYGKEPGDIKLRDVNGDGVYVPSDDKRFLGYKTPQYRLGLRNDVTFLKHFEFSSFIRADLGFSSDNDLFLGYFPHGQQFDRGNTYEMEYWTPENPSNEYPRLNSDVSSPSFLIWKDRSFVRLQNVSLAYNVPVKSIERFKITRLKFYVSMLNALTFTSWNHYDPESGKTPMPKNITFGLDLGL